jgi:ankyrin repeat protein
VDSDPIVDWLFNWWRYRGRSVPLSKLHEIVQLLLANGVHVDARNNIQATALIMNGHVEDVIRELLDDGADPTLRDEHGDTALADAREMNCEPCIDLLETAVRQREASGRNVRK